MPAGHQSVLLSEAIDSLKIAPDDVVVDATVGGAGHFDALRLALGPKGLLVGIDADSKAIERAQTIINAAIGLSDGPRVILENDNFRNLESILDKNDIQKVNKVLFDLGWSGYQLLRGRGFSFQTDEPLLMTYGDPGQSQTALEVVNGATEEELADMLHELGEERFARRIAKGIVEARRRAKIESTFQLVDVVKQSTPAWYQHKRIHPATKTFQALRIYVNDELGALDDGLGAALKRTETEGRIAVITFHSIEDRAVKQTFRQAADEGKGMLVTKKPVIPSGEELAENPRARSAKLRVFEVGTTKSKNRYLQP